MEGELINIMKCYAMLKASLNADKRMLDIKKRELDILLNKQAPKEPKGVDYDKIVVGGVSDTIEEVFNKIADLKNDIDTYKEIIDMKLEEISKFEKEMKEIEKKTNDVMFKVFYYKYVEGIKPLDRIATRLNYGIDRIKQISAQLSKMDFINNF